MKITHTEVDKEHSGKGIATELVKIAVEYARHKNLKVKPLCSLASHVLKKDNYSDILEIFKQVKINIPLLDAIKKILSCTKILKDVCTVKRRLNV